MKLRIRYRSGPALYRPRVLPAPPAPGLPDPPDDERPAPEQITFTELAAGTAVFLAPFPVLSVALAIWRIAADLRVAAPFFLEQGVMSHWQAWFLAAVALQMKVSWLRRKGLAQPAR